MNWQFDVTKVVGAASAPVALIIATSIFLSNVTTKWWAMTGVFRALTTEYREMKDRDVNPRAPLVREQLSHFQHRLRLLVHATLILTMALISFILTVMLTALSVLIPGVHTLMAATVGFSFLGLVMVIIAILVELIENNEAKQTIHLELVEPHELAALSDHVPAS